MISVPPRPALTAAALLLLGLTSGPAARAFNYHELEVYPYRTAAKGELELENSTAHTLDGANTPPGANDGLTRTSVEATYGLTSHVEVAAYGDFSHARGGTGLDFAGQRYRLRARFAEKGQLPVDVGVYAELEMPKHDEDTRELELRGILEKDFGPWTVDLNPLVEKVLKGRNTARGWELGYAAAVIYRMNERVQPRLEFFGNLGPIQHFEPHRRQIHLISPALTYSPSPTFHLLGGVAFGMTDASEQTLLRLRLEKEFYF